MASINTEKPAGKAEQNKKLAGSLKQKKQKIENLPVKEEKKQKKKVEEKVEKTEEKKPEIKEIKKIKKTEASVHVKNLSISTKVGASICKFIIKKKIGKAIQDLEEVSRLKKGVPMKGEYAHRKGKIMSGKYPVNASNAFITLLKSLQSNATQHDIEDPIISMAFANKGPKVYASRGRKKKRTHVKVVCSQKKEKVKSKKKEKIKQIN